MYLIKDRDNFGNERISTQADNKESLSVTGLLGVSEIELWAQEY